MRGIWGEVRGALLPRGTWPERQKSEAEGRGPRVWRTGKERETPWGEGHRSQKRGAGVSAG